MIEQSSVPVKKEPNRYSAIVCQQLKGKIKGKDLFAKVYGREGTPSEVQTFVNRLNPNRSNPGADIIGELVERLPHLHDVTLAEFFGLDKSS
ncbi:hypothetical protein [Pseudoalteromonas ulvae]|uniref:Uncharacterized protein n=1 Tax=Pseudoalteromonas ulvae TaxID=107327 RepID=A0A244CUK2_PSEDV|nr:hypothetical protein [Pseudoalteromonas ulvae]OUL59278.1 hypothetical protein B1199_03135 [Pseudoalteromonas ulvae]